MLQQPETFDKNITADMHVHKHGYDGYIPIPSRTQNLELKCFYTQKIKIKTKTAENFILHNQVEIQHWASATYR